MRTAGTAQPHHAPRREPRPGPRITSGRPAPPDRRRPRSGAQGGWSRATHRLLRPTPCCPLVCRRPSAEPGAAPRTVPLKLGSWRACRRAPLGTACTGGSARLGSAPGRSRTPHTGYGGPQEWNAGRERRANRPWEWTFRAPQWSGAGPARLRRTPSTCARRSTGRRPRSRRSRSPSGAGRRRGSTGRGRGSRRRRTSAAPGRAGDCKRGRGRSTVTQCRFAGERSPRAGEPRACGLVVTARRSVEPDP